MGGWSTDAFQPEMDAESDSNTIVHGMASCTLVDSWEEGHPGGEHDVEMDCETTGILDSSEEEQPEEYDDVEMDCESTGYSDTPDDEESVEEEDDEPMQYACNGCGRVSLQIYHGCRMCLNETCEQFFERIIVPSSAFQEGWRRDGGDDEDFRYVTWFLRHQPFLENEERVPYPLKPSLTLQDLDAHQREDVAAHNLPRKTGFYCSACGRLSVRIYWGALIPWRLSSTC